MNKQILKSGLVGIAVAMASNLFGAATNQPAIDCEDVSGFSMY